ncbi:MAG: diversity-generating retroelement protein Avd [Candidatus Hydrogenedentes bacterium]|jgi:hypothetical protein|nr:diversity-generating retroelement protein Avd [Candidatus Hydrogenedentota bacterium]
MDEQGTIKSGLRELRALTAWMEFLAWLLPTTEKFPKKVRLTLTNRIDNLALDVAMTLTEAQYSKTPGGRIREANLLLTKMRLLLRLSHTMAFLPHKQYEHASRQIDDVGRMIGAWGKM